MPPKGKKGKKKAKGDEKKKEVHSKVSICLCMIVKNESKIITRCLNSAKLIIDYVSICDTGSTDATPDIIRDWCVNNNIPGTVHSESFKNFGHNRTLSVELARKTYPQSVYLLLLDADMMLEVTSKFRKSNLTQDCYHIQQYNNSIGYWNTRLIRTSQPWKCKGVTHEYWDGPKGYTTGKSDELIIDDREDGGCKSDKFDRDKKLLTEGIEDKTTPEDLRTRYLFYLAQTERDRKDYKSSIEWYTKRVKAGGWNEEVYYAQLQIGVCYEALGNFELASHAYLEAHEIRPCRGEALYSLTRMYRVVGKNHIAFMFAQRGRVIPYPKDHLLFVDYHVYDYLFDFEMMIVAYYVAGERDLAKACFKRLNARKDKLPDHIRRVVEHNSKFYV